MWSMITKGVAKESMQCYTFGDLVPLCLFFVFYIRIRIRIHVVLVLYKSHIDSIQFNQINWKINSKSSQHCTQYSCVSWVIAIFIGDHKYLVYIRSLDRLYVRLLKHAHTPYTQIGREKETERKKTRTKISIEFDLIWTQHYALFRMSVNNNICAVCVVCHHRSKSVYDVVENYALYSKIS